MAGRKIIITYKKQSVFNNATGEHDIFQRPPFETVEENLPAHEKLYNGIIKEVKFKVEQTAVSRPAIETKVDAKNTTELTDKIAFLSRENERLLSQNVHLTVALQDKKANTEIDNKTLVEYFIKKDKTHLSIAKYLNLSIDEVNKLLPEMVAQ